MWSFLSRRYVRPIAQVGVAERVLGTAILLFTGGIAVAFIVQATSGRTSAPDGLSPADEPEHAVASNSPSGARLTNATFPDPGIPEWRAPRRVFHYTRENLYTKIDGQAPAYIAAGFEHLLFGAYRSDVEARRTIDVYLYDMGRRENAEAMFRAEAAPGAANLEVGDQAYQSGAAVFFRQGAAYVQVVPTEFGESDASAARSIAERVSDVIGRREAGGRE